MQITKVSPYTGKESTFDIPVTQEQLDELNADGPRRLVQEIFPDLQPWEREFLLSGYTEEDWEAMFGEVGPDGLEPEEEDEDE